MIRVNVRVTVRVRVRVRVRVMVRARVRVTVRVTVSTHPASNSVFHSAAPALHFPTCSSLSALVPLYPSNNVWLWA